MPPSHWQSQNITARLLEPLAWLYGRLFALRAWCYRIGWLKTTKLPVPVIVVGNVIAGGVGKTPIVSVLVRRLQMMGYHPGIISRGYGRRLNDCQVVTSASTSEEVGDEPLLLHSICQSPVIVASDRVLAAKTLLQRYPQCNVLVSDDGLQHTALARDVEIVVFDERRIGNARLLPAGPLREPWPRPASSVAKTHIVVNHVKRFLNEQAKNKHGQVIHLKQLASTKLLRVHALAGIAKPKQFFSMLKAMGVQLTTSKAFPDHADYKNYKPYSSPEDIVLCTEKDAVKIWPIDPRVFAVALEVELDEMFLKAFDASMNYPSAAAAKTTTPQEKKPKKNGQKTTGIAGMPRDQRPLAL